MTRAFPSSAVEVHLGMTLRDYFAGQALVGILAGSAGSAGDIRRGTTIGTIERNSGRVAYEFADAMIAERDK